MATAVTVEGLSKRYELGAIPGYRRLSETIGARFQKARDSATNELWALRDVGFEVSHGEAIGIVGRNGAGKSTLLKILSRITQPTAGRAILQGRVGSLLEVGTGFHPELTGRENVFLNGAVLGMRRAEITRRFDEIVAFAEVERFLDTPVKRYSSGMYVRLAFAVAAHLEPEILIVDEVLAVGDAAFQNKCLGKMEDVARGGRTVLFVSHNLPAVRALCSRAVLLERGEVAIEGTADAVLQRYARQSSELASVALDRRMDREGTGRVRITEFSMTSPGGDGPMAGTDAELALAYTSEAPTSNMALSIALSASTGEGAMYLGTELAGFEIKDASAKGVIRCRIRRLPLMAGSYSVNLFLTVGGEIADWIRDAAIVEVEAGDFFGTGRTPPPGYGAVMVDHAWDLEQG